MNGIQLAKHQIEAIEKLKPGSILKGGTGSGKSRTALAYFFLKECHGDLPVNGIGDWKYCTSPMPLYIITTAKKRDDLDWQEEALSFCISSDRKNSFSGIELHVDSWQNITKYSEVENSFFIFDEQRLIGYGKWVKTFLKIAKRNRWILLTATPGDNWLEYLPVFIAHGFYKNKSEFVQRHVVYSRYSKFPRVDRFVETKLLKEHLDSILVDMKYQSKAEKKIKLVYVEYDASLYKQVVRTRVNPENGMPIRNGSDYCYILKKVVNSDPVRCDVMLAYYNFYKKLIVFYNFDYELSILREFCDKEGIPFSEWNGHKHEDLPKEEKWIYLVQYTAGSEAWNCTETNAMLFYSLNPSYKINVQAEGRIDRMNTKFSELHYIKLLSRSPIDLSIYKAYTQKKNFNASLFCKNIDFSREKHML